MAQATLWGPSSPGTKLKLKRTVPLCCCGSCWNQLSLTTVRSWGDLASFATGYVMKTHRPSLCFMLYEILATAVVASLKLIIKRIYVFDKN